MSAEQAAVAKTKKTKAHEHNIQVLDDVRVLERIKVLDKYCFPVKYGADYYANVGKMYKGAPERQWSALNNVAYFQEMLVGSITTRLEPLMCDEDGKTPVEGKFRAYIMTVGVLEPYRRIGIAQALLRRVVEFCESLDTVDEVGLHVQHGSSALKFYESFEYSSDDAQNDAQNNASEEKRRFVKRYDVPDYYTDVDPKDATYISIKLVHKKPAAGAADAKK